MGDIEVGNDITEKGNIEGKQEGGQGQSPGAHRMGVKKHLKSYYLV